METEFYAPRALEDGLLVEAVGEELIVCDTRRDTAHVLNVTAAAVWRACDGERNLVALQQHCGLDRDTIELALQQLRACGLLHEPQRASSISRRELLRKGAIAASLGAVLPVIQSVTVPAVALAATTTGPPQTTTGVPLTTQGFTTTTPAPTTAAPTTPAPTTPAPTTTAAPCPPPHRHSPDPLAWLLDLLKDLGRLFRRY
jgi:hypothetical protein